MVDVKKLKKDDTLYVVVKNSKIEIKPKDVEGEYYVKEMKNIIVALYERGKQIGIMNNGGIYCKLIEVNGNVVRVYLDKNFKLQSRGGDKNGYGNNNGN